MLASSDCGLTPPISRQSLRRKHAALEAALDGHMREHQCFLLAMQLRSLEAID